MRIQPQTKRVQYDENKEDTLLRKRRRGEREEEDFQFNLEKRMRLEDMIKRKITSQPDSWDMEEERSKFDLSD